MLTRLTPASIHPPLADYCHATLVPPGANLLFLSGQLGIAPDGGIPEDVGAQARQCFANIRAILEDAGMAMSDLVRLNAYLTDEADLGAYMAVRDQEVGRPTPASTLFVVKSFSQKQFKVEIEAVAAKV
jgi:enamine deaminase RidA (YjgF/YER057c/UK114 family)